MGYRSDVKLLMKKDTFVQMQMDCEERPSLAEYVDAIDEVRTYAIADGTRYVEISWNGIKWYDDDVQDYLMGLPADTYYEFMRIGEDYDDIEGLNHVPSGETYRLWVDRVFSVHDFRWRDVD